MKQYRFTAAIVIASVMIVVTTLALVILFVALLPTAPTYAAPPQIIESEDYLPMIAFEGDELKKFGFDDIPQIIDTNSRMIVSRAPTRA